MSALSAAYYYQQQKSDNFQCQHFLPVLNIPKRDYPLKTEVTYLFNKYCITEDALTFKDELTKEFLESNKFILVDHHKSPYSASAAAVFDHRPRDDTAVFDKNCLLNINAVGSCCTLIAELYLSSVEQQESCILNMLRSTIILDTVNFSEAAARATPKDHEICSALEKMLNNTEDCLEQRDSVFKDLVKARSDVTSLTAAQLLRKDLKLVQFTDGKTVALPGFPLRVQDFILKLSASEAVLEFAKEFDCAVVLLMGMFVDSEDKVHRDFGIINIKDEALSTALHNKIIELKEPQLMLDKLSNCDFLKGHFYKQNNIKVTRKHIMPIVKELAN